MKRILAASLSLIGFTTSSICVPGYCQGGAIQSNTTKINNALPGGKRPTNTSGVGLPALDNHPIGQVNSGGPALNTNVGGVNANVGGVNANIGAGKLNSPSAASQSQLNPGRLGNPLGAIQGAVNSATNAANSAITDISVIAPDPDVVKQQQRQAARQKAQREAANALNAPDPVQQAQDNLTQVEAANSLNTNPDKGTPGANATGTNSGTGSSAAAAADAANSLDGPDPGASTGSSGTTGSAGGSPQDEAAGALGGGQSSGGDQSGGSTSSSSTSGSSGSGTGGKPDGDGSGSSSSGSSSSIVDEPNLEGGSGVQQSAVSKLRGAAARGAGNAASAVQGENLQGAAGNLQSGAAGSLLQNSGIQNRLRNEIGGSQFNGQNVSTFSAPAPDGFGKTGRQLPGGARFSGVGDAAGSGQTTGVKTNLPGVNNRLPGSGIFTPRDPGAVGSSGIKGGANINNVGNSGVSTPNVNIGSGAKLDTGRGALGNTSVGNINQQINQLNDVAAGQAADGRPGDRAGGSVPGGGIQHGEITGTGSGQTTIFDNPEPHQVIGGSGQGFGGANGEVDFVPDSQNRTPDGTSSGSFGNPSNATGTDPSAGSGRIEGDSRTPAGTGDHTSSHSESGGSGSGDGGDSASTGHVAGHDDSRTSGDHDRRGGGDSSIFEHPTNGTAGAVSAPGSNIHIEQDNLGNVNANVGENIQGAAGAIRGGAVGRFGAQLNGADVQTFSKQNEGAAPSGTGFRNGVSPFGTGGRFSGISTPGGSAGLPGAATPLNLPGRTITSPVNGIGGRIPGAVNTGLTGAGGATVRSLPGAGASGGGGLPGAAGVKVPVGNISPVGGLRPNLPNLGAGAGSIKLTPNLNLGGATPSRGNQPSGAARTPANTGRPNIPAPGRR